jgi:para-nitrobenzyl esterase
MPLIAGSAKEEVNAIIIARAGLYNAPPGQYQKKLEQYLYLSPEESKKAAVLYPLSAYDNKVGKAAGYILTDLAFGCPTFLCMDEFSQSRLPTYYYRFEYRGNRAGKLIGAMHAMELPLVFGAFDQGNMSLLYGGKNLAEAQELSRVIQGYWTNFAKSGDPNGSGLPAWPRFDPKNPAVQILDTAVSTATTDMPEKCGFWDGYAHTREPIFSTLARKQKKK